MLPLYREPLGLPLRWQDEQSTLPDAVHAYFEQEATEGQLKLVRQYLEYHIKAPCWYDHLKNEEDRIAFDKLIEQVKTLKTAEEILNWIYECLEWGIDPL